MYNSEITRTRIGSKYAAGFCTSKAVQLSRHSIKQITIVRLLVIRRIIALPRNRLVSTSNHQRNIAVGCSVQRPGLGYIHLRMYGRRCELIDDSRERAHRSLLFFLSSYPIFMMAHKRQFNMKPLLYFPNASQVV